MPGPYNPRPVLDTHVPGSDHGHPRGHVAAGPGPLVVLRPRPRARCPSGTYDTSAGSVIPAGCPCRQAAAVYRSVAVSLVRYTSTPACHVSGSKGSVARESTRELPVSIEELSPTRLRRRARAPMQETPVCPRQFRRLLKYDLTCFVRHPSHQVFFASRKPARSTNSSSDCAGCAMQHVNRREEMTNVFLRSVRGFVFPPQVSFPFDPADAVSGIQESLPPRPLGRSGPFANSACAPCRRPIPSGSRCRRRLNDHHS